MNLLDLFCCAGGAAMGYYQSGLFDNITGVDNKPQKRYPFNFVEGDALNFLKQNGGDFDIIHASPPCQAYSVTKSLHNNNYPMLIDELRSILIKLDKPYIIENVPGSPLHNPVVLCGSMFDLPLIRHRNFELSYHFKRPITPPHKCKNLFTHSGHGQFSSFENGATAICVAGHNFKVADGKIAMGIDWMIGRELAQAIPPVYTKWLIKAI